jgi:hypothetical protein
MALTQNDEDLTSLTPGNYPNSPPPIPRASPATGHDAEMLEEEDPDLGYGAEEFPYQQPQQGMRAFLAPSTAIARLVLSEQ